MAKAIEARINEDILIKKRLEEVRSFAHSLEDICSRLSGGVYYEHRERTAMIYLHGLAAAIRQDIEVIESSAQAIAAPTDSKEEFPVSPYRSIDVRISRTGHLEGEAEGEFKPIDMDNIHDAIYGSKVEEAIEKYNRSSGQKALYVVSYNLRNIVRGMQRPVFLPRESRNALIGSTLATYAESNYYLVTRLDVLSIYTALFTRIPEALGPLVPSDERSLLRAYVMYLILDQDTDLLNRITGFRDIARAQTHVSDNAVLQRTKSYLSDLKAFAEFPLEKLIMEYVELIKAVGKALTGRPVGLKRKVLPLERSLDAQLGSMPRRDGNYRNDDEPTVDPEQYKRMLAQRDKVLKALASAKNWGAKRVLSHLAKFYYDSNPWNYLTYFEAGRDPYNRVTLVPSERKVEPVYVDYTGNLAKIDKWMEAFCKGEPVSNLALIGDPGTGKTAALLIASTRHNIRIVNIDFNALEERNLPEIMGLIRANKQYPTIIYLDNLDVTNSDTIYRLLNNLERYIEGPTSLGNKIKFAMSTSTYNKLPVALRQRYGSRYDFKKPDMEGQLRIADAHMKQSGIRRSPQTMLREIYGVKRLDDIKPGQYLAPREIRDKILEIKLQHQG
ncbi:DUF815 domain-containing protein [Candidatus Woesearchaeota archaeon]|nr:DUF815 domain-containing protein [Candidatus Woesearchaeota archaeon]